MRRLGEERGCLPQLSRRPTSPATCSRSSITTSSTLAGPKATPRLATDQYDKLRTEHDQGAVEIVVHIRAILLFMTDSEPVRRVHEACLDDLATGRREA